MKYTMGLDIGISSVGWAIINEDKKRIENLGVRLFDAAERPKDGGAINEARRLARGLRRRLKRKRVRMSKIKDIFVKYYLVSRDELDSLYLLSKEDLDTWQLRAEGLDRLLTNAEWARALTCLTKRRGYKSNRKIESNDSKSETGKLNSAIKANKEYMAEKGYRTIGEMFAKDERFSESKRNKNGSYTNCVDRSELKEEIHLLFESQRKCGSKVASLEFESEFVQVFEWQKDFMSEELMKKMIGKCRFEKEEPRAPKNSASFERFMLLQKVNNLSYQLNDKKIYLTEEQRKQIIKLAYEIKSGVKYARIKKELGLDKDTLFTGLSYYLKAKRLPDGSYEKPSFEEVIKKTEDAVFVKMNGYFEIKSALENDSNCEEILNDSDLMDSIADALTLNKTDVSIKESLAKTILNDETIDRLLNINFIKFGHLSYKAIKKILPSLEEGLKYDKACETAGYNFKDDNGEGRYKLPVIPKDEIRNPVVYRAVTQTRKVINAIIDKYGSPFEIHVEVARELGKDFKERGNIKKKQDANRTINETLKTDIKDHFNINAKAFDMLKVKLYREQNGKSAYSMTDIDYNRLFEDGYVQVDHIVPFSRSFDDSYNNKVLVKTKENQDKKNMTPYEYLGGTSNWEEFEAFVKSTYRNNAKKRENLLVKHLEGDKADEWLNRNLVDTQYIARFMSNFIKKNLAFDNYGEKDNRVKVKTIPGAVTTALRHYWGIPSKNRELNLHHAEDAVIIACASGSNQKKITEYSKQKELYYTNHNGEYIDSETGEIVDVKYKSHEMARPWDNFKEELEARMSKNPSWDIKHGDFTNYDDVESEDIKPIFVSRMPNRKVTGQAHEETVYSVKHSSNNSGVVTVKKSLSRISQKEITDLISKKEYKSLYNCDKELYDAIYNRLKEYDFKAEKAFSGDYVLRKKAKVGEGPIVKSIKVPSVMNSGVKLSNSKDGIATNGNMVRVDVFEKGNKYYLVPIYVADMIKEELPNRAIVAAKPEEEWILMDASYNFKFSLYKNDLVLVKKKKDRELIAYYNSTHRRTGAINLQLHDGSENVEGIGVQNLEIFDKYVVDVLGNYHKVNKETRKGGKK